MSVYIDNNSALTCPNTYIELYAKSMHCYCLYTAIISDINGYYYQYSNYLPPRGPN